MIIIGMITAEIINCPFEWKFQKLGRRGNKDSQEFVFMAFVTKTFFSFLFILNINISSKEFMIKKLESANWNKSVYVIIN